jgi:hypothetical protein
MLCTSSEWWPYSNTISPLFSCLPHHPDRQFRLSPESYSHQILLGMPRCNGVDVMAQSKLDHADSAVTAGATFPAWLVIIKKNGIKHGTKIHANSQTVRYMPHQPDVAGMM